MAKFVTASESTSDSLDLTLLLYCCSMYHYHLATMHSITDRQMDRQQYHANVNHDQLKNKLNL